MNNLKTMFQLLCQEGNLDEHKCSLAGLISNIPADYIDKSIEFICKFDVNDANLLKVI